MMRKFFSAELAQSAGLALNRFPETKDEVAKAEEVLSKELEKLTLDEQERILFDIHGLPRCTLEDDPEALEVRLKDLDKELENITKGREAYDEVRAKSPAYVDSRRFRLQFLRSEAYDAKAAAEMIITHFHVKKKLFGEGEILWRDVRQSDLPPMAITLLESGYMQIFPSRDAAGRTILAVSPEFRKHGTKATLFLPLSRATWYFTMTMMQDEETQRKGVVLIMYNYCGYKDQVDLTTSANQLRIAMPQRIEATHICSDDPTHQICVTGVQLFVDPNSRFRLRPHLRTVEENDFELQTFGIPTHDSPMKVDGTWSTHWHKEWLTAHRVREESLLTRSKTIDTISQVSPCNQDNEDFILVPRRFDVLFGKGKREREHTGNLRALHLCDMYWEAYESSNKYGKTEVAEKIVLIIQQSGGRFLKPTNSGAWVEVDDTAAREKIAHFFRFMRSKNKVAAPSSDDISSSESSNTIDSSTKVTPAKRDSPCSIPDPSTRVRNVSL